MVPKRPWSSLSQAPAPLLVPSEEKAVALPAQGAAATPPAESPTPEKLSDFVNFLNGENPGACMFHAQMRLSPEGCMKLANFLKSSARVRALSLSHNYLGEYSPCLAARMGPRQPLTASDKTTDRCCLHK
jgi:hypothetical protein